MNKVTIIGISIWIVLAIIFIVGQFVGATVFFVICNDIFAAFNGILIFSLIPQIIQELKARKKENK